MISFNAALSIFFEETVIRPIGRQRLHDIEPAVVGNEPVVVQIIHQICDLREPSHFITIKAQTMASLGKPRRPVVALGSVKSKLLKSLS